MASMAKAVVDLAEDEGRFKKLVKQVGKTLEKEAQRLSPENREELRDSIRSDTFFSTVKQAAVEA